MTYADTLAAWLACHPRLRRTLAVLMALFTASLCAVACAPAAAASTGAAALGWTGITDTDGVPLKDYFLAVVDTLDALTNNGQQVSAIDPTTWVPWLAHAAEAGTNHVLFSLALTAIASGYVMLMGLALWFVRFALSSAWLVLLAQIGQPVYSAVNLLVNKMWLGPIAVTLCLCVALYHYARGHAARAWAVVGSGVIIFVLSITIFSNPIADLYSDNGLLATGRATGMTVVDIAHNGSYAPGKPLDAQLDTFISEMVTTTVRHPLQTYNFGQVIDNIGNCGAAWSTAIRAANGQGDGPAQAMKDCGAAAAFAHAQHLGADDLILGAMFLLVGVCFTLFLLYVGLSVLLVGVKADYYGIIIVPALLAAMSGVARIVAFAKHAAGQLILHAIEMAVFIAYLGVVMNSLHWLMTTSRLGPLTDTVVPRMFLLLLASILAALGFRVVDHSFHTDGLGTIAHQISSGARLASESARGYYDDTRDGLDRTRQAADRYRQWRDRQGDDDDTTDSDGDDAPGFDVVKARPAAANRPANPAPAQASATAARGPAAEAAGAETATAAAEGAAALAAPDIVIPAAAAAEIAHHRRNSAHSSRRDSAHTTAGPADPSSRTQHPTTPQPPQPAAAHDDGGAVPGHQTITTGNGRTGADHDRAPSRRTPAQQPPVDFRAATEAPPLSDDAAAYEASPRGRQAPPIECYTSNTETPEDPALEFPATKPPRRTSDTSGDRR